MTSATFTFGSDFESKYQTYDDGRIATGVDEMVGLIFGKVNKPLNEVKLLDAGGGSGNYAKEFFKRGIGNITLLDGSKGMLDLASQKMQNEIAEGRLNVMQHRLPYLPFADSSFDVVCLIYMIHLLDEMREDGVNGYPNGKACIEEVYRVLKPGGIILISLQSPEQSLKSAWYFPLIPNAVARCKNRFMSPPDLQNVLREKGFREITAYYRPGEAGNISEEVYRNLAGPFSEDWRKTRSMREMVEEEELQSALRILKELKENGTLDEFYKQNDRYRQDYGQDFNLVARK